MNSVANNGPANRFRIGLAWAVAKVGRVSDLVGELGRDAGDGGRMDVDIAWASLVQDSTTVPTGSGGKSSPCAAAAARSRNLSPRGSKRSSIGGGTSRASGLVAGCCGAVAHGGLGIKIQGSRSRVEGAWLGGPVLREIFKPHLG